MDEDGIEPSPGLTDYGFTVRANLSQYLAFILNYIRQQKHYYDSFRWFFWYYLKLHIRQIIRQVSYFQAVGRLSSLISG